MSNPNFQHPYPYRRINTCSYPTHTPPHPHPTPLPPPPDERNDNVPCLWTEALSYDTGQPRPRPPPPPPRPEPRARARARYPITTMAPKRLSPLPRRPRPSQTTPPPRSTLLSLQSQKSHPHQPECLDCKAWTSLSVDNLVRILEAQDQKLDRLLGYLSWAESGIEASATVADTAAAAETIKRSFDDGLERLGTFLQTYKTEVLPAPNPPLVGYAAFTRPKLKLRTSGTQWDSRAGFLVEGVETLEEADTRDKHEGMMELGGYDGITEPAFIFDLENQTCSTLDTGMDIENIIDLDAYENQNEVGNEDITFDSPVSVLWRSGSQDDASDIDQAPPGSPSLASPEDDRSSSGGSPPPSPAWILSGSESPLSDPPKDLDFDTLDLDLDLNLEQEQPVSADSKIPIAITATGTRQDNPPSGAGCILALASSARPQIHNKETSPLSANKRRLRVRETKPDYVNHPMDSEKKKSHTTTTKSIRSIRNLPISSGRKPHI